MIINDVQHFLMVVLLLVTTLLMVIHYVYIQVKVKPSVHIKKYLAAHFLQNIWGLLLLIEYIILPEAEGRGVLIYLRAICIAGMCYNIIGFIFGYCYKERRNDRRNIVQIIVFLVTFIMFNFGFALNGQMGTLLIRSAALLFTLYLLIALTSFVHFAIKAEAYYRTKQNLYFIGAIGFNLYAQIIFILDVSDMSYINLMKGMPIYLVILIAITMKYQLYDRFPFVFETILSNVNQGIIVMNNYFSVIEFNKDFFEKFMDTEDLVSLDDLIQRLKNVSNNKLPIDNIVYAVKSSKQNHYSGEFMISSGGKETQLSYSVNSIFDNRQKKVATMLTFRDITEMTQLQKGIRNKNNQLIRANKKLEEHIQNMLDLTVEKERDVLMTEINDTFGHSMTELLALLEVSALLLEQEENNGVIEKAIEDTIERARAALAQMRASVSRYKEGVADND